MKSATSSQRLRKRSHPDIHVARVRAGVLEQPVSLRAKHSETMRVVNHQPGIMPPFYLNKGRQVGNIAVHAVQAFNGDQHALELLPDRRQQRIQRHEIIVRKRTPLGTGQDRTGQDAVVGKALMDDQILRPENGADGRNIGRVAADENDAIFLPIMLRQGTFEYLVSRPFAGDQPARGRRRAERVNGGMRGFADLRMMVQAKIIIRRIIDVLAPADECRRAGGGFMEAKIGIVEASHGCHRSLKFKFAIPRQILKVHHAVQRRRGRRPRDLWHGTGRLGVKAFLNHFVEAPSSLLVQPSSILRLHANVLGFGGGPGEAVDSCVTAGEKLGHFRPYVNAVVGHFPQGSALAIADAARNVQHRPRTQCGGQQLRQQGGSPGEIR